MQRHMQQLLLVPSPSPIFPRGIFEVTAFTIFLAFVVQCYILNDYISDDTMSTACWMFQQPTSWLVKCLSLTEKLVEKSIISLHIVRLSLYCCNKAFQIIFPSLLYDDRWFYSIPAHFPSPYLLRSCCFWWFWSVFGFKTFTTDVNQSWPVFPLLYFGKYISVYKKTE